jgi:hypothetical protein
LKDSANRTDAKIIETVEYLLQWRRESMLKLAYSSRQGARNKLKDLQEKQKQQIWNSHNVMGRN